MDMGYFQVFQYVLTGNFGYGDQESSILDDRTPYGAYFLFCMEVLG